MAPREERLLVHRRRIHGPHFNAARALPADAVWRDGAAVKCARAGEAHRIHRAPAARARRRQRHLRRARAGEISRHRPGIRPCGQRAGRQRRGIEMHQHRRLKRRSDNGGKNGKEVGEWFSIHGTKWGD